MSCSLFLSTALDNKNASLLQFVQTCKKEERKDAGESRCEAVSPLRSSTVATRMATPDKRRVLRIRLREDSARCGVFLVRVHCGEPVLLRFWSTKPVFCNGQVEQTEAKLRAPASVDFVLRVMQRAPNLPKSHYWGPFVLELCLDALPFGFRLPAHAHCGVAMQSIMEECGELLLLR